jgi:AraC-like DNA-binding protein
MQELVPSRVLEGVAGLVKNYGHDPDDIAASIGLTPEALYRPDLMIDVVDVNDMLEESAVVCRDRFFCLRLARIQSFDVLGPIWLIIRNSRTVGERLELLADNYELHTRSMSAYLLKEGDGVTFCWEIRKVPTPKRPRHTATVQVSELAMGVCCYELRRLLGNSWRPEYVQFRHARPADTAPMRAVFGDSLHFNQDVDAFHISREDFNRPVTGRSRSNGALLQRALESTVGRGMPFVLRVDRIIRLLINGEGCSAEKVAEALDIKLRTLQYRLKQNQTSYQALYDAARLDLAKHYLKKSDLSIAAVSERLYFNDCAAFSRFFRARAGHSPREYARHAREY